MKKLLTFLALSVLVAVGAYAQWTKPAAPASVPLQTGETLYLYNSDADAFFLGANDWETRASVSPTKGYQVCIEKYDLDDISYYLSSVVENKENKVLYTFIDGLDNIWVDQTKESEHDKLYTFEDQGDGTYRIGMSPANRVYIPATYPGAYLGVIPEMADTRLYFCDSMKYNLPTFHPENYQTTWYFVAPENYQTYVTAKANYLAAVALKSAIDKALAENEGIDIAAIEAVYNNCSRTRQGC